MRAGWVAVLVASAIAGAVSGCEDDRGEPAVGDPRPDTYVPAPGGTPAPPMADEICDPHPSADDAGDARPTPDDPRTLVLRLDDLPEGARFEPSSNGVGTFTFEGEQDELERRYGFVSVARGGFAIGRREPEPEPGAPEPPPSCLPETGIESGAMVFRDARGADRIPPERLAGMTVGSGIGPVDARVDVSDSPVEVGDEADLVTAPTDREGTINRTIVWRDGRLVGMVKVEGRGKDADVDLLERLARTQAGYLEAAAG